MGRMEAGQPRTLRESEREAELRCLDARGQPISRRASHAPAEPCGACGGLAAPPRRRACLVAALGVAHKRQKGEPAHIRDQHLWQGRYCE